MLGLIQLFFILAMIPSSHGSSPEELPGGVGTSFDISKNAFSKPLSGVSKEENNLFFVGNSFFKQSWVVAPSSTTGRDGLGPNFNSTSCSGCHLLDGRGPGYTPSGNVHISLLFRLKEFDTGTRAFRDHTIYGGQLQPLAVDGVPSEFLPTVQFTEVLGQYADGSPYKLRKPTYTFKMNQGPLGENAVVSPRLAPQVPGLGLIENIPAEDILSQADEKDENQDGISGRANSAALLPSQQLVLGRFGWKAEQPTVHQQNAAAFLGDLGITSSLFPDQNCTAGQSACLAAINGGTPEITDRLLDAVTIYMNLLAVPRRRHFEDVRVAEGKKVFETLKCQQCHTESYTTGNNSPHAVLNGQSIFPYSDFLLHNMGPELGDISLGSPDLLTEIDFEWRTPPLWGLGLVRVVNRHMTLLHDGRAKSVEEAILWHGGEGERSREAFKNISAKDRENLVFFVESL